MTVHCSYCGEELLGSVNRCWRCGREMEVTAGDADIPPIRRPPVEDAPQPATATTLDETASPRPASPFGRPIGQAAKPAEYPQHTFSESCAITSVVVGVLTAIMAIVTPWSLVPAMVGVLAGAIGAGSRRQRTAIVGIVLCGLIFLISASRVAISVYGSYQQRQQEAWENF